MVDSRVIALDKEILAMIFRLPEGQHGIELRPGHVQSTTYRPTGFNEVDASENDYNWKNCTSQLMTDKILFQRYALHMQDNREFVWAAQVFQAEDTRDRAWMSHFCKKLYNALAEGKRSVSSPAEFVAASHVQIILMYYYQGWGYDLPRAEVGQETLSSWHWTYLHHAEFGRMQGRTARMGLQDSPSNQTRCPDSLPRGLTPPLTAT